MQLIVKNVNVIIELSDYAYRANNDLTADIVEKYTDTVIVSSTKYCPYTGERLEFLDKKFVVQFKLQNPENLDVSILFNVEIDLDIIPDEYKHQAILSRGYEWIKNNFSLTYTMENENAKLV